MLNLRRKLRRFTFLDFQAVLSVRAQLSKLTLQSSPQQIWRTVWLPSSSANLNGSCVVSGRNFPTNSNQYSALAGNSNATNERGVDEVFRICDEDDRLEVVKLGEMCRVRLVVQEKGAYNWMGVAVGVTTKTDSRGRYNFSHCKSSRSALNVLAWLQLPQMQFSSWWVIPGILANSPRIAICKNGKWSESGVAVEALVGTIVRRLRCSSSEHLPLSDWNIPKSRLHRKEERLFAEAKRRIYDQLRFAATCPKARRGPTDVVLEGIQVQNKTAYSTKGALGLHININKYKTIQQNGKQVKQPYHISDLIDAIVVYCVREENLCGMFIFPKSVLAQHGWFGSCTTSGKTTAYVYPPYITPRRDTEIRQSWQREYYLDLSRDWYVDLDRARRLLNSCRPNANV